MLNPAELEQNAVQESVDALVDSQGGLLLYDHGLAGREALLAAGAQLAVTSGLPLTVVDAEALREPVGSQMLQPAAQHLRVVPPRPR